MNDFQISLKGGRLQLGEKTCIMGILNVTPDSFSDGGKFYSYDAAVARGEKLIEDGAHILDIGGESTRPFAETVPEDEEINRVVPVIKTLARRFSVPISIDTTKAEVARQALDAGAAMVNDVSALRFDERLAEVAANHNVPIVLMHMLNKPETMQIEPHYDNLIVDIKRFLAKAVQKAVEKGIPKSNIIIDPGLGFGKTADHNLLLIKHLSDFQSLNLPILVGPSRKFFIRSVLKTITGQEMPPDHHLVGTGTLSAVACAVLNGARIVRVHDVADTRAAVALVDAVKNVQNRTSRHQ